MEVCETVALEIALSGLDECPFCESDDAPPDEKWADPDECEDPQEGSENAGGYRVRNDSSKLSDALEADGDEHPELEMVNPWAFDGDVDDNAYAKAMKTGKMSSELENRIYEYEVKADPWRGREEGSWIDDDSSWVRCNAHHLIPGNAALFKAKTLLVWFAKTVERKTVRTYDTDEAPPSLGDVKKKHEAAGVEVQVKRSKTKPQRGGTPKPKDEITETVTGKVKGKVPWELNGAENGIWLPSNNAIAGWSAVTKADPKFGDRYATQAVRSTRFLGYRQFHDAHESYSEAVMRILDDLAEEMRTRAEFCRGGQCPGSKKGEKEDPLPAPTSLKDALERLSQTLAFFLSGKPSSWKAPFHTSSRNETLTLG